MTDELDRDYRLQRAVVIDPSTGRARFEDEQIADDGTRVDGVRPSDWAQPRRRFAQTHCDNSEPRYYLSDSPCRLCGGVSRVRSSGTSRCVRCEEDRERDAWFADRVSREPPQETDDDDLDDHHELVGPDGRSRDRLRGEPVMLPGDWDKSMHRRGG